MVVATQVVWTECGPCTEHCQNSNLINEGALLPGDGHFTGDKNSEEGIFWYINCRNN